MPLNEFKKTSELINQGDLTHVVGLRSGSTSVQPIGDFVNSLSTQKPLYYVVDGDSLTGDDGLAGTSNWFNFLCNQLDNALVIGKNWARAGKSLGQCNTFYETAGAPSFFTGGGHQFSPAVTGGNGIYFLFAGTNDLGSAPLAADLYVNITQLVAKAKADGYAKVAVFTIPARTIIEGGGFGAASETQRLAFNTLIRANAAAADYIVDLAAIYTNSLSPEYADGLHFTAAGQRRIATIVRAALNDLHPAPHIAIAAFSGDASMAKAMSAEFPGQVITGSDGNSFVIAHIGGSGAQPEVLSNPRYYFDGDIFIDGALGTNNALVTIWRGIALNENESNAVGAQILFGSGSPEAVIAATVGSIYLNRTGGGNYEKRTGSGNTGWVKFGA